ncbi:phosphoglycerate mutase [Aeromicrobium sp. Root495]|uniref:histidine phosphatase family protein n=1 Tax=Aeromicrobium sp. Root495 TaxID=1736550 RepID=UPI0006FEFE36|nr:histidine phosphatase family protein [Aeromicrobium sp. Root495]KQY60765.1 phosphoglycerate mutase [Aeromicrobium sp. Root495]RYJ05956.1 MAG: histidine phosphatase family protein [Actinomycetales bacterium]
MTARLFLVRHGETEWSRAGKHTSTTDLPLTADGERSALALKEVLARETFEHVLTSPRVRARRTAELAGFPDAEVEPDLAEWAYGDYEGVTTPEIRETVPGWTIWTHPTPNGETSDQVAARLDRVVAAARSRDGDTLVFAHGHSLRVLVARWLGLEVQEGRHFLLDTATLSRLGDDRGQSVVEEWNVPARP